MFTITKQDSIIIAVTLGIILSVPVLIPALYTSTEITVRDQTARLSSHSERARDLVKSKDIGGNEVITQWRRPNAVCGPSI
jgi:hypothetical protein